MACSNDEKVVAVLPFNSFKVADWFEQMQIEFVYEGGRLQGVLQVFLLKVMPGEAAQFVINERDELFVRGSIACARADQQARNL